MNAGNSSQWDRNTVASDVRLIVREGNYARLVEQAQSWATQLGGQQDASKAQIRRLFGEIKQIEMKWSNDRRSSLERLRMLKPRLAYAAAKPNVGRGVERLRDILTPAVDAVLEAERDYEVMSQRFRTFVRLTEALLAYFTAARGGEGDGVRPTAGRESRRPRTT
jgi:CRISPR type III-A-associated protein Csm2